MLQAILPAIIGTLLVTSITAALLALSARPWQGAGKQPNPAWGPALGLGVGYAIAHGYLMGWPAFPPVSGKQWVFVLALISALLATIRHFTRGPRGRCYFMCGLLSLAVPLTTLQAKLKFGWELGEAVPAIGLIAALVFLWLLSNEERANEGEGAAVPLALAVSTFGASAALGLSSSATLAELAGMLTAGISIYVLACWRWQFLSITGGGVSVVGVVLAGLLINGYFFAELPLAGALLLGAAPEAVRLTRHGPLKQLTGWKQTLTKAALVAVPVGAAVALALAGFLETSAETDPYAGY